MTLRHLRIFLAVCTRMSITAAAGDLGMSQPAVSTAVRELEVFYQARLFDRRGRRLYLTAQGEQLRGYAATVVGTFEESVAALRGGAPPACGIGANVTVGERDLPGLLQQLREAMPQLAVRAVVADSRSLEAMLLSGTLDFALMDAPTHSAGFAVRRLRGEEMAAVCAPALCPTPVADLQALARLPLLLREPGSGTRRCVDAAFEAAGVQASPTVQSISASALLALAEAGQGVAVLPEGMVQQAVACGRLVRLALPPGTWMRHCYLVHLPQRALSPTVQRCMQLIERALSRPDPQ